MVDRPRTAHFGLLLIIISLFVTRLAQLVEVHSSLQFQDIPLFVGMTLALFTICVIFCMPFRDPRLPSDQISPAYEPPTHALRSPEDNLTLWQFVTFSWMSPLITLGSTRQLNEEDVWSLSFEFQHKALHEQFRELKGTVVRRLLAANGIDLVIISVLGVLQSLSRIDTPRPQRLQRGTNLEIRS